MNFWDRCREKVFGGHLPVTTKALPVNIIKLSEQVDHLLKKKLKLRIGKK